MSLPLFLKEIMENKKDNDEEGHDLLLLQFLHRKSPQLARSILSILAQVIQDGNYYDPNNPCMILCDKELEAVLNVKSCHVGQLQDIIRARLNLKKEIGRRLVAPLVHIRQLREQDIEPMTTTALNHKKCPAPADVCVSPYREKFSDQTTVIVRSRLMEILSTVHMTVENEKGKYRRKPYQAPGVMKWSEVVNLFIRYIQKNKKQIIDPRNEMVFNLGKDPLGVLFGGVTAIHRSQAIEYLHDQVILANRMFFC